MSEEYKQRRFIWRSGVEIGMEEFVRVVSIFVLFGFLLLCSRFSCWDRQSKLDILNSFLSDCSCSLRKSRVYLAF